MTDREVGDTSVESSNIAASHIGTLIATPDNDEQIEKSMLPKKVTSL